MRDIFLMIQKEYQMKKLTKNRGLNLSDKEFHCKGAFAALHKGKPDAADIADVF